MEDQNAKELHEEEHFLQKPDEVEGDVWSEEDTLTATDRIMAVITSPKRAFEGLLNVPRLGSIIGISMVVGIILSVVTVALMYTSEEYIASIKNAQAERFEKVLADPSLSSEQKENIQKQQEATEEVSNTQYIIGAVMTAVLGPPIMAVLFGLLFLIIAKIIEQGHESRVRYSHALTVASLTGVIYGVGSLIMGAIARIAGSQKVLMGLAGFVDTDSVVLTALLGVFSLPILWWIGVSGLGIATIAKGNVGKATAILFGFFILLVVILGVIASQVAKLFGV